MNRRKFHQGLLATGFCLLQGPASAASLGWKSVLELRHPSDINVEQVDLASDGKTVATWATDGSLALWNIAQQKKIWSRSEKTSLIGTNRTHLICVDRGQARRVTLATGAEEVIPAEIEPIAVSANGEWWAGLRERSNIYLWNSKTMRMVPLSAPPVVSWRPESRLYSFSEDGRWFIAAQGVRAILWDINKPDDPITLKDQPGEITNLRLSRDASWILQGALGGTLDISNRLNPKLNQRASYGGDLRALWLDGPNNQALIGCSDGGLSLAQQSMPGLKKPSALPAEPVKFPQQGDTWSCCLRGKWAASGHQQGQFKIWKWA